MASVAGWVWAVNEINGSGWSRQERWINKIFLCEAISVSGLGAGVRHAPSTSLPQQPVAWWMSCSNLIFSIASCLISRTVSFSPPLFACLHIRRFHMPPLINKLTLQNHRSSHSIRVRCSFFVNIAFHKSPKHWRLYVCICCIYWPLSWNKTIYPYRLFHFLYHSNSHIAHK